MVQLTMTKVPVFLLLNEKIQITKFLPKNFCRDFPQISMSLVKIGQNKEKKIW